MKYPYNKTYQPAFPALKVVLSNVDEGIRTEQVDALLDTGADGTLIPINYLQQLRSPVLTDTRIRSHWGEWRPVQLFVVDIELNILNLSKVFVVGDDLGDEIVLGRNIINRLHLLLDGPANLAEVLAR